MLHGSRVLPQAKARTKWLQEGDMNTNFFHSKVRGNTNRIKVLCIKNQRGHKLEGHNQFTMKVVNYFSNLLNQNHNFHNPHILNHAITKKNLLPIKLTTS